MKLFFPVPSCFGIGWGFPLGLCTLIHLFFSLRNSIFSLAVLYNACSCCSPFKEVNCSLTGGSCLCNCAVSINKFAVDVLVIAAEEIMTVGFFARFFLRFAFVKLVRNLGRFFYNYECGKKERRLCCSNWLLVELKISRVNGFLVRLVCTCGKFVTRRQIV